MTPIPATPFVAPLQKAQPHHTAINWSDVGFFAGLGVILALAPLFASPTFLMKTLCFALFATSFNFLLGYGGLMSFGHAAYFGMASYVSAYTARYWGFGPGLAIVSGTLAAVVLGAVGGAISIRRQGIYFSMITLALAQMVYFFSVQTPRFSGGEDGIQSVPRGRLFGLVDLGDDMSLYVVVAVIFVIALLFVVRMIRSPFGQALKAIRDNEQRAISLGYRANSYKLMAFILSTALAGLAGAMKAIVFQVATLADVHWSMSGEPVMMTLVGGLGTIAGPVAGAAIMVGLETYLAPLGAWIPAIQGILFLLCVLLFRDGLVGVAKRLLNIRSDAARPHGRASS
jgi:branched-chain amino acid transport system permease protein